MQTFLLVDVILAIHTFLQTVSVSVATHAFLQAVSVMIHAFLQCILTLLGISLFGAAQGGREVPSLKSVTHILQ